MSTTKTQNAGKQDDKAITINLDEIGKEYTSKKIPNPLSPDFEEIIEYGDYLKLREGENKFRVLSKAIIGYIYWKKVKNADNKEVEKPVRIPLDEITSLDIHIQPKQFIAFFVYNYEAEKIQILSTDKKTVIKGILDFTQDEEWGEASQYDLKVKKTKTNPDDRFSVNYSVKASIPTVLDKSIEEKWIYSGFTKEHLYLLFEGIDPFEYQRNKAQEKATS